MFSDMIRRWNFDASSLHNVDAHLKRGIASARRPQSVETKGYPRWWISEKKQDALIEHLELAFSLANEVDDRMAAYLIETALLESRSHHLGKPSEQMP